TAYSFTHPPPPALPSTLSPYTTLFRSRHKQAQASIEEFPADMKIHEYQAKAILARHGVPVPRGETLADATDAAAIARRLGTKVRSEEHTSELQSRFDLVCRLLLEKKN